MSAFAGLPPRLALLADLWVRLCDLEIAGDREASDALLAGWHRRTRALDNDEYRALTAALTAAEYWGFRLEYES